MAENTRLAAGFILASVKDGKRVYLLLRNARHGAWGFAKGHAEGDETAIECARRETLEETGISDLSVVQGFEHRDEYQVKHPKRGSYNKQVVYFLATTGQPMHKQSHEHSDSAWLPFDAAMKKLQFDALKKALKKADERLGG
ncbi:MAG: NUDIX domain-containing protein [Planctomycetes bacterium]|nr:NUDIX domain-containing protein [Planctomycetota bacterium]